MKLSNASRADLSRSIADLDTAAILDIAQVLLSKGIDRGDLVRMDMRLK